MKKILFLALLSFSLVSCNSTPDSPPEAPADPQGQRTGDERIRVNCTDAWNRHVAANPEGRFEKYAIEIQTKMGDRISFPGRRAFTSHQVLSASQEEIVSIDSGSEGQAPPFTLTRAEFLKNCDQGLPGQIDPAYQIQVLEQGARAVQVPAGTFYCYYVKTKITPKSPDPSIGEIVKESYTDGSDQYGFLVKSISTQTFTYDGQTTVQTSIEELVERK